MYVHDGKAFDSLVEEGSCAFAALYLAGGPRPYAPNPKRWPQVEHVFRAHCVSAEALERFGLYKEALLLSDAGLMAWARGQASLRAFISVFSPSYPSAWLRKLGSLAPPALWVSGTFPSGPFLGLAGSRSPFPLASSFAASWGSCASAAGYSLVSGGAAGCDSLGMASFLRSGGQGAVRVLPRGLIPSDASSSVCSVSLDPPGESFSSLSAMRRNALIYALSDAAAAVQPRFREGGTWHGAYHALRSRLCRVFLMSAPSDLACSALSSLGASVLSMDALQSLPSFRQVLLDAPVQPCLFGAAV